MGNKKYKSFGSAVAALKRQGKSDESARKIVGKIQSLQEGSHKGKRKSKK